MKMQKTATSLLAAIAMVGSAHAQVVAYEGFTDYTSPLNTQGSGTSSGWSGNWAAGPNSGGTIQGTSDATLATGNLSAPTDYVFASGSTSGTDADGQYISDIGGGAIRTLGTNIDLGADGTTYFSALWNESGSGSLGNLGFKFLTSGSFGRAAFDFTTVSSQMLLRTDNTGTTAGGAAFTAGSDYLIVGKIDATAAGADTISLSIWENGTSIGSEPVTWAVSGNVAAADQGVQLNRLYLQGSGNTDQFDEIRFGSSFADVTGVPEPSSFALLLCGSLALYLRRRHRS